MEKTKPKLLITGVNGYIGSWVTLKALKTGEYQVRGTVRGSISYIRDISPLLVDLYILNCAYR